MAAVISKDACVYVRNSLFSLRSSIEKESEELRMIIRDGCASYYDKEEYEYLQSSLVVLSALLSCLRDLERGAK